MTKHLRRSGRLHAAGENLSCVLSSSFSFSSLSSVSSRVSCCHTSNAHTNTHLGIKTAMQPRGYSSLRDYLPTFHPSASNLPQSDGQSLKTSFLLSSSLSLSVTLARGEPESLAWKMLCLAVSPVIENITQAGAAPALPHADACVTAGSEPNLFTG